MRGLVTALEESVVALLAEHGIEAGAKKDAPGVYVDNAKVASVGLRIRRGSSFHGMALNVDVELEPFSRINPCGFKGLEMTDLKRLGIDATLNEVSKQLLPRLAERMGVDAEAIRQS